MPLIFIKFDNTNSGTVYIAQNGARKLRTKFGEKIAIQSSSQYINKYIGQFTKFVFFAFQWDEHRNSIKILDCFTVNNDSSSLLPCLLFVRQLSPSLLYAYNRLQSSWHMCGPGQSDLLTDWDTEAPNCCRNGLHHYFTHYNIWDIFKDICFQLFPDFPPCSEAPPS